MNALHIHDRTRLELGLPLLVRRVEESGHLGKGSFHVPLGASGVVRRTGPVS